MKEPGTTVVAMSPITTGRVSSSALVRSTSAIGSDSSMPVTGTPRSRSGTPTRPVPMANSRARPFPASRARKSRVGARAAGEEFSASSAS